MLTNSLYQIQVFQNSHFPLKSQISLWQPILSVIFLEVTGLLVSIFQKISSKYPILNHQFVLVGQVKMVSHEKQPANSALSSITQVPFLDNHHISIRNKSALCILPISYIKMIHGLGFSRVNNLYCFIKDTLSTLFCLSEDSTFTNLPPARIQILWPFQEL